MIYLLQLKIYRLFVCFCGFKINLWMREGPPFSSFLTQVPSIILSLLSQDWLLSKSDNYILLSSLPFQDAFTRSTSSDGTFDTFWDENKFIMSLAIKTLNPLRTDNNGNEALRRYLRKEISVLLCENQNFLVLLSSSVSFIVGGWKF